MNHNRAVKHLNNSNAKRNLIKETLALFFGTGAMVILFGIFIAIILNGEAFDKAANTVQKVLVNDPSTPIILFLLSLLLIGILIKKK